MRSEGRHTAPVFLQRLCCLSARGGGSGSDDGGGGSYDGDGGSGGGKCFVGGWINEHGVSDLKI